MVKKTILIPENITKEIEKISRKELRSFSSQTVLLLKMGLTEHLKRTGHSMADIEAVLTQIYLPLDVNISS